ncbi:carbohydrate esterase family 4 protein [Mycena vulgaris]|nr:carbohydrate esterase family 4 protein [Mycena vulgaris]
MRTTILLAACAGITSALTLRARDGTLANVFTSCTVPGQVALTFDDGPYIHMKEISDKVSAAGGKATFFVNGLNWDCIYDAPQVDSLKYAYGKGHQIASHTWSHPDLTTLSQAAVDSEITKVDDALVKILGVQPAFLRPPYGNYNDIVRTAAAAHNNKALVTWDFDSGDSTGATSSASKTLYDNAINAHPATLLALNHETSATTVSDVLPHAIQALTAGGYKFVTVAECLGGLPAYSSVTTPGTRDASWTC